MKKRLIGRCALEEQAIQLWYYLTEKEGQADGSMIYGIEVRKLHEESHKEDSEAAYALSYSEEYIEWLANLLYRNQVTPLCMLSIIDESMTKEFCTCQG